MRADVTVTFGCLKPALVVGPAAMLAGQVDLVDIGLPWLRRRAGRLGARRGRHRPVVAEADGRVGQVHARAWPAWPPVRRRTPVRRFMSVAGALAGPAGMVRYAGVVADDVARTHPSVMVSHRVAETGRVQAWLCGCGLGTDERAQDELRAVLGSSVPVVLDADALTMLSDGAMATGCAGATRRPW